MPGRGRRRGRTNATGTSSSGRYGTSAAIVPSARATTHTTRSSTHTPRRQNPRLMAVRPNAGDSPGPAHRGRLHFAPVNTWLPVVEPCLLLALSHLPLT